ncbi:hypothetical protein [Delftia lacustris]|uniref:hypothetical protein n=1 Tax=Delftia lacustris TaxID=558537 RepID=UPI001160087E|nr:hypothetical protein [Delftia lacustris]
MPQHSWCCSSSVSSWGDSSGQFSLQSFLPASGMPVSQALFLKHDHFWIFNASVALSSVHSRRFFFASTLPSRTGLRLHAKFL